MLVSEDGKKKEKILSTFLGLQKIKVDRGATKNDKVVIMLWPTNKKCTILFCVWLVLLGQHGWHTIFWLWKQRALKHRSNVSTTPITAMGCQQHLPLSVVQLKGKHWWKPYCGNGVVHMFKHLATARQKETVYRGFLPYATFETWKNSHYPKIALAKFLFYVRSNKINCP